MYFLFQSFREKKWKILHQSQSVDCGGCVVFGGWLICSVIDIKYSVGCLDILILTMTTCYNVTSYQRYDEERGQIVNDVNPRNICSEKCWPAMGPRHLVTSRQSQVTILSLHWLGSDKFLPGLGSNYDQIYFYWETDTLRLWDIPTHKYQVWPTITRPGQATPGLIKSFSPGEATVQCSAVWGGEEVRSPLACPDLARPCGLTLIIRISERERERELYMS